MEDDVALAHLLRKRLERAGYAIDLAYDGEEGLAKYQKGSYDLIVVDNFMPGYDGLDVIRSLVEPGPLPPAIMLTGTGNEAVAVEAMKLGVSDYIVKDVDGVYLDLLPLVIEQVLNQYRLMEDKRRLEEQMQVSEKIQSLGLMAGGIAHEFNNLLQVIIGNVNLAHTKLTPDSFLYDCLKNIEKAAERAATLSGQMLAYSGHGLMTRMTLNFPKLVDEVAQGVALSLADQITLEYHFAKDLPTAKGDPFQMREVIRSLITNSIEAIGDREGVISVRVDSMEADRAYLANTYINDNLPSGLYVFLEVTDNGCGIDSETLEKVFDPFFTTKFTGRGLDLAATLGIVRRHKGAVTVASTPEIPNQARGRTTFRILLPTEELSKGSAEDEVVGSRTWRRYPSSEREADARASGA
jgi:signal transduction histidine kinase